MKRGEEKVIVTDIDFEWPERVKLNVEELGILSRRIRILLLTQDP